MNKQYLDTAKERVPNVPLLINIISKRVRQLNQGQRPMVKPDTPNTPNLDVALKEVADGKLTAEINYAPPPSTPPVDNVITI